MALTSALQVISLTLFKLYKRKSKVVKKDSVILIEDLELIQEKLKSKYKESA
jgi:hypothetical protein